MSEVLKGKKSYIKYRSGPDWPDPINVWNAQIENFLIELSTLSRKYNIFLSGSDYGVELYAKGIAKEVENRDTGEKRLQLWEEAKLPTSLEWDDDLAQYTTSEEREILAKIKDRKGLV